MDTHTDDSNNTRQAHRVDRLLDAIELVKADRRAEALPLLRDLIREDSNSEEAWLWMSLAVDELDQSLICLDNVLRINPDNVRAATALYQLNLAEEEAQKKRTQIRQYRDWAAFGLWVLIIVLLFATLITLGSELTNVPPPA